MSKTLILTNDLFLSKGNHKEVYTHPDDKNLCIKILYVTHDSDFEREMKYRRALGSKADKMTLLTKYFGTVDTNMGTGYVFENVFDFDGSECKTVLDHIQNPVSVDDLTDLLVNFKQTFINEKFIAAGMDPKNFLVQRLSSNERRVRIIDNIGTSAKFPIVYYSSFLMVKRARKYWRRFVREIQMEFSNTINGDIVNKLL